MSKKSNALAKAGSPSIPESFVALVDEMRKLGLNVQITETNAEQHGFFIENGYNINEIKILDSYKSEIVDEKILEKKLRDMFGSSNLTVEQKRLVLKHIDDELKESILEIPESAPSFYAERADRSERPVDFIRRVYAPWVGRGLTQPDVKRLDPKLYMALHNWLRTNPMPTDLALPTKSEAITSKIEQLGDEGLKESERLSAVARLRRSRPQHG